MPSTLEIAPSPNLYVAKNWQTADLYRHVPSSESAGELHIAVWSPGSEVNYNGNLSGLGLVLAESDSPRQDYNPFLVESIEELAKISNENPASANLLATLGIAAASIKSLRGEFGEPGHLSVASTFPSTATLNDRMRWIGSQLAPSDRMPYFVSARGEYSAANFKRHFDKDEVLMSDADASGEIPNEETIMFAAHDMLSHALPWSTLTSTTRQAMRDRKLSMDEIDVMASLLTLRGFLTHGQHGFGEAYSRQELINNSAGVFGTPFESGGSPLLQQQLTRFKALEKLPPSPFPDPRDILASNFN